MEAHEKDFLATIIGAQQIDIVQLRMEVMRLKQYEPKPADNVTPIEAAK